MTPGSEEMRDMGARILAMLDLGPASPVEGLLERARGFIHLEDWEGALDAGRLAAEESLRADDTHSRAIGLVGGGLCALAAGDLRGAVEAYRRAAQLFHILGDGGNEAAASLGYAYARHYLGDLGEALRAYQYARGLFLGVSDEAYAAGQHTRTRDFHHRAVRAEQYANSVLLHPVVEAELPRRPLLIAHVAAPGDGGLVPRAPVVAYELSLDDRPYSVHGVQGRPRAPLEWHHDRHYFAVAVPVDRWPALGARRGDYLLVQQEAPGPTEDTGWVLRRRAADELELLTYEFEQGDRKYRPVADDRYGPVLLLAEPGPREPALTEAEIAPGLIGYVVAVLKPLLKADR